LKTRKTKQIAEVAKMNKAVFAILLLGILVLSGCAATTTVQQTTQPVEKVTGDITVDTAASDLMSDNSSVEIGEML
jgi:uncharacterized lipoprotein YajG